MKPKVLLFAPSLGGGGAERVMVTIANSLACRNINTQLVIAKPDLTYAKELTPEVRLINLNTYRMLQTILPLARYLQNEQPDVVLSTLVEANMVAVIASTFARTKARIVVREASTPSRDLLQNPRLQKRLTGRCLRWFYRRSDAIIAISKGVYRDLVEGMRIPVSKVHLIHNPVPLQAITQKMQEPVDHPWFQAGAAPVVLSVGRLEWAKDYPTLIQAFGKVRETVDARLLILGEGSEREALQRLIEELQLTDSVQLAGFDPNPFRYMRRATVYVLSSRYEGFPNALVQALACGCPIVSTDCESGPRDILNDGQYGMLVSVGDTQQLAEAILKALRQPPPTAPPEWIEQFDEDHVINRLLEVIFPPPTFLGALGNDAEATRPPQRQG